MTIQLLLNIPAADNPEDVVTVFEDAGYKTEIPPQGIMPASKNKGGKSIVHCVVSDASYQDILDVTSAQRPVWQIFGALDLHPSINPDYDLEDPESQPMVTVVHKAMNNSVWNFIPDNKNFDGDGNPLPDTPQTQLHEFQGCSTWPGK